MRKPVYIALAVLLVAVLAVVIWEGLREREPVYQGKPLSTWVQQGTEPQREDESLEQVSQRWAALTNVVRSLGPNALPCAVRWLKENSHASLYDRIQSWVEETTRGRIRLPGQTDGSPDGLIIIQILGPVAQPVIPDLAGLLLDEHTCGWAAMCLAAIGPASLPALSNAVAVGSSRIRYQAINALGELGLAARPTIPLLSQDSRTNQPEAIPALRALVEIDSSALNLLPFFNERLTDPNTAPGAAYALARLGPAGLPALLLAFTNSANVVRAAAAAALDPRFQRLVTSEEPSDFYYRTGLFGVIFNSKMLALGLPERTNAFPTIERGKITPALLQYSTNADPAIRSAANLVLESFGRKAGSK